MQLDTDFSPKCIRNKTSRIIFEKRSRSQIEIDEEEKIDTSRKFDKMRNYNDFNKSEHQMMKILKTKPSNNNKIIRICRRSTLSNQEYEHLWYDCWFTDEFSEESSELYPVN